MKRVVGFVAILLALAMVACGGSSSSNTTSSSATGAWSATLNSTSSQSLGTFTFNMMQNNTSVTGSSMNFAGMGSLAQCFGAGTVITGQMSSAMMMNGGTMTMTMTFTPSGSNLTNTMTMQANMGSGMRTDTGNFNLVGQTQGCTSQSGTFTMVHTSTSMM